MTIEPSHKLKAKIWKAIITPVKIDGAKTRSLKKAEKRGS